ncbi:type IV pilus modification protein PilV [Colwellia sp. D2M02]|uniref:type IV pilus modification protein PilV n=1 Tax=Colwellia sp. D2M02 TaxID=2841562 RepID=UPI001C083419|nr:type IV pilus modification protein PilV [Colwellia sp. D2M02]MBU2892896.1 type IV pilus modification protein PilV [Colwellia sp. D2M02]
MMKSNNFKYICSIKRSVGMTFIEVLVALVILSTGILGAVALQATAKQGSFDAMQRSLASSLAQDIIARIRANNPTTINAYIADDYGDDLDAVPGNRCTAACTAAELVTNDRYEWELALMGGDVTSALGSAGGLLGATGCIAQVGSAITVVVSWQARKDISDAAKVAGCGTAGAKRRQVVVQAFII